MKKSILISSQGPIDPKRIAINKLANSSKKQRYYAKKVKALRTLAILPFCLKNVNMEI
jgi:ribosomal protein S18